MATAVIYTGPRRIDLGIARSNQIFVSRDEIPERIKEVMGKDSAFAHFFEDLDKFRKRPAPGSHAFAKAKISREPPIGRTLVHPPLRRHR
jgi:hypothetical protein